MERETENPFAAVIRIMRGNTPQGVFAERLGIKQAKYSHYENHRREPSLDELCRIARALDTTPNVLLGFEPPPLRASASPRETNINGNFNIVGDGNNLNVKVPPPSSSSSSTAKKKGKKK
jgi:transcriptional regulator with XRE-family HTH domain